MPLLFIHGDITKINFDAIVNSADTSLLEGGSVAECIHKASGRQLKLACAALGGCDVGDVKATKAYKLPCKYVIHAVAPVWQSGQSGEEALLASCYRRALLCAVDLGCSSVAFPLLATGMNGYPLEQALHVAVGTIAEFLQELELDVFLVVLDGENSLYKVIIQPNRKLLLFAKKSIFDIIDYFRTVANEYYYTKYYDDDGFLCLLDGPSAWIEDRAVAYYIRHERVADAKESLFNDSGKDWLPDAEKQFPILLKHVAPLDENCSAPKETWAQMLVRLMNAKGLNCKQCARRANISVNYLQRLCFDEDVYPSKSTALAIAIAVELSVDETRVMLARLGFMWQRCDLFEVITEFFIDEGIYDIHKVNLALFAHKQSLLGLGLRDSASMINKKNKVSLPQKLGSLIMNMACGVCNKIIKTDANENESVDDRNKHDEEIRYSDDGRVLIDADSGCLSVGIPDTVNNISVCAFTECSNLVSVSIPDSVTKIGHKAFSGCIRLKAVRLPAHLTSASAYLFANCRRLEEVMLPEELVEICEGAFFNCEHLSSLKLPLGVKSIGSAAFWNCRKLEVLNIPAHIESIGKNAFYNCQSLRSVVLPAGLTKIASRCFMNCHSIISVMLPASINHIGGNAFSECRSLVSVDISDGDAVNEATKRNGSLEQAAHEDSFSQGAICECAFWNCSKLTSVRLPAGITKICIWAFADCESLISINIPDMVIEIGDEAFAGCRSLEPLVIPDSVSKIGDNAFEGVPCVIYNGTAEGAPWGAGKVLSQRVVL